MTYRHAIVSAGLVAALCTPAALLALPSAVAVADPASELSTAQETLEALGSELSQIQSELQSATDELEQTDYDIAEMQAEIESTKEDLASKQEALGTSMRSSYKTSFQSLLSFVLGSTSAEDLVSRIYYLDKISNQQASAIEDVRTTEQLLEEQMAELESTQATQQELVANLEAKSADYQTRVADARAYVESLAAEVQAQLEAQAAAEAAAQAESEAAASSNISTVVSAIERQEQVEASTSDSTNDNAASGDSGAAQGGSTETGESTGGETETTTPDQSTEPDNIGSGSGESGGSGSDSSNSSSSDSDSSSLAGQGVAAAYAQLGKAYVYGATGPNSFDCSGLVCYCFGWARGRTTYAMISSIKASGGWKTSIDQLSYGDLVFTNSGGHVGIYVGNGKMIHAANESLGVIEGTIYGFIGGGSYY